MPETAETECYQHIQRPPDPRNSVAAERDIEVIAEPCRQTDVPRAPELSRIRRQVRQVEILKDLEAENACGAGGDVFTFLMRLKGLTFPAAVEEVARLLGLPLPQSHGHTAACAALMSR